MLRIDITDRPDFSGAAYRSLFERSDATAFQHPEWLTAFENLLKPRGAQWRVVSIFDGSELVACLPLTIRRKTGMSLLEAADLGVCDYCAPVIAPGRRETIDWQAVRRALRPYDLMRVRNVRPQHSEAWAAILDSDPRATDYGFHDVPLCGSFDEWHETHVERSLASQTRRKWKRWQRGATLRCDRLRDEAEVADAIRTLADLRAGRFEGDPIQEPAVRAFYADVACRGHVGFAETWRLSDGGRTAGVLFGVTHRGTFHYLLIGCDYETFGRHSPGFHLYDRVIEDWMRRGGTCFDFTIGDEPFKARYGTARSPICEFHAGRTIPGRIAGEVLRRRAPEAVPA